MDAVYLTLFVSTVLAVLGVVLFLYTHGQGTRDHEDRLALLPLDDPPPAPVDPAAPLSTPSTPQGHDQ